jgi:alpha-tubulin suppressor-like RCC1 family protein
LGKVFRLITWGYAAVLYCFSNSGQYNFRRSLLSGKTVYFYRLIVSKTFIVKKTTVLTAIFCCALSSLHAQPTYTHVECGTEFTLALRSDSTLWTCGFNENGQLGNAIVTQSDTLMAVLPAQKWIYAATGAVHAMAIASDSTLWGWGLNGNGQLGTGTVSDMAAPAQVSATKHWRYVSAGEAHTVAILNNGTLWAAGFNMYGQLGTGDTVGHTSFVQVGAASNRKTVSAGGVFTLGIKEDGTLWAWGYNGDGELGTGNTANTYMAPAQIGTATNWAMVSGGFEFSLAMKSDGTIWSTGFNGNGQLGISTVTSNYSLFTQVGTDTDWKFIAAGSSFGLAIKTNGSLWG